jgi:N utilization substance protein B
LFTDIEPTLKNWDAERVAILDMVMLKMALCELLHFPTIPTKVTLNEYVEISKLYSTDKSKEFINGILDRLMKELLEKGRIVKEGRGLIE